MLHELDYRSYVVGYPVKNNHDCQQMPTCLFLACLCLSQERQTVRSTAGPKKKKKRSSNSLDQIPIRVPAVHTPQLAHGTGPVYDFRAFEDL